MSRDKQKEYSFIYLFILQPMQYKHFHIIG